MLRRILIMLLLAVPLVAQQLPRGEDGSVQYKCGNLFCGNEGYFFVDDTDGSVHVGCTTYSSNEFEFCANSPIWQQTDTLGGDSACYGLIAGFWHVYECADPAGTGITFNVDNGEVRFGGGPSADRYENCHRMYTDAEGDVKCLDGLEAKSIAFGASYTPDGTQCTRSTVTLSSKSLSTITCADSASSQIFGNITMPDRWDAGLINLEMQTYFNGTPGSPELYAWDCSAACGVATAYGSTVALDIDFTTAANSVGEWHETAGPITVGGSCVQGATLYWQCTMDAGQTTATVANVHILGFKPEFYVGSYTD